MDKDIDKLRKRLVFYSKANVPIHSITESDEWINGYIKEIYDDYFTVVDRKSGLKKIFLVDIRKLDYFKGDVFLLNEDIMKISGKKEDINKFN